MWWGKSLPGSRPRALVCFLSRNAFVSTSGLLLLALVSVLAAQWVRPVESPDRPREVIERIEAPQDQMVAAVASPSVSTESDDPLPDVDPDRQAAAGPQPDADTDPEADAGPQPGDSAPESIALAPISNGSSLQYRVGIQAGHWKSAELPSELAGLRSSTGTSGGGVAEWELNLDIARRVAALLQADGIEVDILPATVPPGYSADAFVALHADGDVSGRLSGFKLARARRSVIPEIDDALLDDIVQEYQSATKLRIDPNITRNMTGYYAFSNRRFVHAIAPDTPAVIVEMGFLTNASDRAILLRSPNTVSEGIAQGILRFIARREEANLGASPNASP